MKPGSKYYPLFDYLQQRHLENADSSDLAELTLTLADIECLIQNPLPASACKRAWWSNRDSTGALQSAAWIQAGYHVKAVDFEQRTVTFQRFKAEYTVQRRGDAILWDQEAVRALRKHMSLTQAKFAQELGVRRQTVSEWENGVYEPDRSTAKHLERVAQQRGFEP
ncbi:MAG: helix-turn-helix transcriptional regulator [Phormidesmis sp.]